MADSLVSMWDIVITTCIILLLLLWLSWKSLTTYRKKPFRNYLIWGLSLKLIGWFALLAIVIFYYGGEADTIVAYYNNIDLLNHIYKDNPVDALSYILTGANNSPQLTVNLIVKRGTVFVIRWGFMFSFFLSNSFILISLAFTILSFWGTWKLFTVFADIYPFLYRHIGFAFLFLPSIVLWGTGISKESLIILGLGLMLEGFYKGLIKNPKNGLFLIHFLLGSWILFQVKTYVFLAFFISLAAWFFLLHYKDAARTKFRMLRFPAMVLGLGIFGAVCWYLFMSDSSVFEVGTYARSTQRKLEYVLMGNLEGSTYSLPQFRPGPFGFLALSWYLYITGLFRPYLWESSKPIIMVASLETLALLISSVYVIVKIGILNSINRVRKDPVLFSLLLFTLVFFPGVALGSGTFGSLVRYKIPCLPFYVMFIILLYYDKRIAYHRFINGQKNT